MELGNYQVHAAATSSVTVKRNDTRRGEIGIDARLGDGGVEEKLPDELHIRVNEKVLPSGGSEIGNESLGHSGFCRAKQRMAGVEHAGSLRREPGPMCTAPDYERPRVAREHN